MALCLSNLDVQTRVDLPVDTRVDVIVTKNRGRVEVFQQSEQTPSVPDVRHVATVINLSSSVF